MRVRRDVSSVPARSASETWETIVGLITGPDSKFKDQLISAAGIMGSIITDEHPAARAIVVEGVGAQLRIYCQYGMKAVELGDGVDALTWNPTAGDWTMHVPCDAENLAWVRDALSASPRIKVFDVLEEERAEDAGEATAKRSVVVVDWNVKG